MNVLLCYYFDVYRRCLCVLFQKFLVFELVPFLHNSIHVIILHV